MVVFLKPMKVLITGGTGFVGRALVEQLRTYTAVDLRITGRQGISTLADISYFQVESLGPETNWKAALEGADVVIHTAARVHVMQEKAADPLIEFRQVNTEGTINLARQAAHAGCKRFIFLSSIKVNGEETQIGFPYNAETIPAPVDAYGVSKCEAEVGLHRVSNETGLEVVILRPPLIYGPGVKGNFLTLLRILHRGIPLPLGKINNQRSFVGIDNLVNLIITCLEHPRAPNQTFLISDGHDLSTPQLLSSLALALGKATRLLFFSPWILKTSAALVGKKDFAQRLCGSLQVNITKTRQMLEWEPHVSVEEGLKKTALHFLKIIKDYPLEKHLP